MTNAPKSDRLKARHMANKAGCQAIIFSEHYHNKNPDELFHKLGFTHIDRHHDHFTVQYQEEGTVYVKFNLKDHQFTTHAYFKGNNVEEKWEHKAAIEASKIWKEYLKP